MNFDRFGFKAKSKSTKDWAIARMAASGFGCFGIRWSDSRAEDYDSCHIYPETLCQCTGLRDSEGNLIYENDYIKITGKEGNIEKALVQYEENILEYVLIFNGSELPIRFFLMWLEEGKKCYVIGNKFDKEVENDKNLH